MCLSLRNYKIVLDDKIIRVAKKSGILKEPGNWQFRLKTLGIWETLKIPGILNKNH